MSAAWHKITALDQSAIYLWKSQDQWHIIGTHLPAWYQNSDISRPSDPEKSSPHLFGQLQREITTSQRHLQG